MRIYLDLDTRRILLSPTRPATRLEFKRRDNDAFEVQFLRAGAVQELPAGTSARVGLKATNDFAGDFLATDTLTQSGTGSETIYSGDFNLNTAALEALFPDEPASITAMLEVEWTTGTQVGSSLTLPVTIHNDVIRGDEGEPADLPLFYTSETSDFLATQSEAESGTDNTKWMSPLRTAQAIASLAATDWDSVSDKPETFPPASHTHPQSDITGLETALLGKASAAHTHPQSDITGLETALLGKASAAHTHPQSDITGLETALLGKASAAHTHPQSDITGLETALLGKASAAHTHPLSDLTQSSATTGQVVTWDGTAWVPQDPTSGSGGVTSYLDLTDVPSTFPPATHTHAISEVSTLQTALDGKAASSHTHAIAEVTGLQTALDGKATSTHTHAAADITSGTLAIARIPTGTTSSTVCIGNDSRLSDSRTPTAHTHGNITNAGAIGSTSGVPIITGSSGVLQAGSFGTTAGTFAAGNHTHSNYVTTSGGIVAIAVVASMPAAPDPNTLYIVTE